LIWAVFHSKQKDFMKFTIGETVQIKGTNDNGKTGIITAIKDISGYQSFNEKGIDITYIECPIDGYKWSINVKLLDGSEDSFYPCQCLKLN